MIVGDCAAGGAIGTGMEKGRCSVEESGVRVRRRRRRRSAMA